MSVFRFLFDPFGRVRRRDFLLFFAGLSAFYAFALQPLGQGVSVLRWLLTNDVGFILFLVLQLVTLLVVIKRLHDRDLSGVYAAALAVPVLGWLWIGYELGVREGGEGANRFGASPKSGYRTL